MAPKGSCQEELSIQESPRPTSLSQDASSAVPDSNTPISYEWLTFASPQPVSNTRSCSAPTRNEPPIPPPDLSNYANPLTWPSTRKYIMLALSCVGTFLTAYTSGSYSPPHQLMREDLGTSSNIAVLAGITTFCVGFALAPMTLAPFSEMNGRYPVFVVAGILYVVTQAICGVVRDLAGMLVARLFVGIGASVFSTMVGGVIADMWYVLPSVGHAWELGWDVVNRLSGTKRRPHQPRGISVEMAPDNADQ